MMAHVEYDVGMVWVEFDYDAELIEELKDGIESWDRTYDPDRKAWGIVPDRWDDARRIIEQYAEVVD